MKLETNLEGLRAIFKPYQILTIDLLLETPQYRLGSGEVWRKVNERLPEGESISRASIIFFLNDLVESGLADAEDGTGKGGHHSLYQLITSDRNEFMGIIVDRFLVKLFEIFPEHKKLSELLK